MLQLQQQPQQTTSTEQIREEIAQMLQTLDDYNVRVVKGFIERLKEFYERANEMHGAS